MIFNITMGQGLFCWPLLYSNFFYGIWHIWLASLHIHTLQTCLYQWEGIFSGCRDKTVHAPSFEGLKKTCWLHYSAGLFQCHLEKEKMDASVGLVGSDLRSLISLVICTWYDLMFNLIMHMARLVAADGRSQPWVLNDWSYLSQPRCLDRAVCLRACAVWVRPDLN